MGIKAPTLPRIRYMCFDLTHAPVATAARAAATGLVSMSTGPDPEGSGTVEIATRSRPRLLLLVLMLVLTEVFTITLGFKCYFSCTRRRRINNVTLISVQNNKV